MTQIELSTMTSLMRAANAYIENVDESMKMIWEQRRYEIAKHVLPYMIQYFNENEPHRSKNERVTAAISYADELIRQLKGGGE